MIVSLHPRTPRTGMPGLSSGVERELQHAFEHTKEVYVVWKPKKNPSPVHHRDRDQDLLHHRGSPLVLREASLVGTPSRKRGLTACRSSGPLAEADNLIRPLRVAGRDSPLTPCSATPPCVRRTHVRRRLFLRSPHSAYFQSGTSSRPETGSLSYLEREPEPRSWGRRSYHESRRATIPSARMFGPMGRVVALHGGREPRDGVPGAIVTVMAVGGLGRAGQGELPRCHSEVRSGVTGSSTRGRSSANAPTRCSCT
jgi:hypothetical protein